MEKDASPKKRIYSKALIEDFTGSPKNYFFNLIE